MYSYISLCTTYSLYTLTHSLCTPIHSLCTPIFSLYTPAYTQYNPTSFLCTPTYSLYTCTYSLYTLTHSLCTHTYTQYTPTYSLQPVHGHVHWTRNSASGHVYVQPVHGHVHWTKNSAWTCLWTCLPTVLHVQLSVTFKNSNSWTCPSVHQLVFCIDMSMCLYMDMSMYSLYVDMSIGLEIWPLVCSFHVFTETRDGQTTPTA